MKKCLAFVLGGGGARGALQVGALRALLEAGFKPDLMVGTSIGAVNAAGLALWGMDLPGLEALERAYQDVTLSRLMDPNLAEFVLNTLSKRPNYRASRHMERFLIAKGFTADLCFGQLPAVRLGLVSANMDLGETVIYGTDPNQSVLKGLMATIALPPWFAPALADDRSLIDGGVLTNLPIEPALKLGATEIIALDLNDPGMLAGNGSGYGQYLEKFFFAITRRQVCVELELAAARNVPVKYVNLRSSPAVPIWDFTRHRELFDIGYETMQPAIAGWEQSTQTGSPFRPWRIELPGWLPGPLRSLLAAGRSRRSS